MLIEIIDTPDIIKEKDIYSDLSLKVKYSAVKSTTKKTIWILKKNHNSKDEKIKTQKTHDKKVNGISWIDKCEKKAE